MAASLVKVGFHNLLRNVRLRPSIRRWHGTVSIPINRRCTCTLKYSQRLPVTSVATSFRLYSSTSHADRKCWKCNTATNEETELFFCNCGVVQVVPSDLSYFTTFELPESFDVDVSKLPDMYKELQRNLHPDKFTQKSKQEQEIAVNQSAFINKAYKTMMSPLERGLYLLELKGNPMPEQESDYDEEFLAEIITVNENILYNMKNASVLKKIENDILVKVEEYQKQVSEAFGADDIKAAKEAVIRLKYYVNLSDNLKKVIRERF